MTQGAKGKLDGLIADAALLDRLGRSIPGLIYVFDLVERRNVYSNRALADHLGYSAGEVQAMGDRLLPTLIHPEDLPRAMAHHEAMPAVPDGETVEIEFRMVARDGTFHWLHSWETVLHREADGRPRFLLGLAHDVTARVHTDEALRESERRLAQSEQRWRSIVENPFDFVVVIDRDYKYTFVNFTAPGVASEDLIGKATPFDFVSPEGHADMRAAFTEVFEHGRPAAYEVFVPQLDRWYASLVGPIREGDVVTHASILTRDSTTGKEMEAQARRAERRLHLAIEGAQEVLFDRDLESGESFVAPRLYELLGIPSDETTIDAFGPGFSGWVHPEDRERVLAAHAATLERGEPFDVELRMLPRTGDPLWFTARGRVIAEPGEHRHFAGFLADATERKAREAELERKHRQLEQALAAQRGLETKLAQSAKLEAVGRLAGGIAHDFNNLLTGISGVAEVLHGALEPDSALAADVADLREAVRRGAGLTRQLLAFSRQQVITPRIVDLNVLLSETSRLLGRLIGEDIELRVVPAKALWRVRADPDQLGQVLLNLAINSRDAMPSGGVLLFELANVEVDAAYAELQPDARPGPFVRLSVSDTGTGMDATTLARVFEPFFTTKATGMGTGLGLATAYGIVRQNSGFIHAYSEVGRGTTFRVYLPRAEGDVPRVDPRLRARPGGSEKVLLVEDEVLVLRLVQRSLEALGYSVRSATRGDDALARIEAGEELDLLLTDVILPGLDGPELYRRAAAVRGDLRVVFMSGYTDNLLEQKGLLGGGQHFLQKPFHPDDLAAVVRAALDSPPRA